jgi:phosphomannomutase
MQNHIFKVSDIRGIVPTELSMQDSYDITKAAVKWFSQQSPNLQRIAVAFDGRLYGQEMYHQVAQAIIDAGYQVYFLGICPTPVFVFGLHQLPVQAGIMITASGSSAQFNGFKFFLHKNLVQGLELLQIYEIVQQQKPDTTVSNLGKIIPCPIMEQYVDSLWQEFAHLSQYDFSVLVDCGNGTTGPVMKKLIHRMGWKQVQLLCDQVDGNFPVHVPNPFDAKNMNYLKSELQKTKKMFGVAFDGDGDRMLALDDQGSLVCGDRLSAMFAQDILAKYAHRMIVTDIKSEQLSTFFMQAHGKSIVVENCLKALSDAMVQHQAIFAAQMHGRFFFKDRHPGCYSDGIYSLLRLFDLLVKNRTTFTDMLERIDEQMNVMHIKTDIPENIKEL